MFVVAKHAAIILIKTQFLGLSCKYIDLTLCHFNVKNSYEVPIRRETEIIERNKTE